MAHSSRQQTLPVPPGCAAPSGTNRLWQPVLWPRQGLKDVSRQCQQFAMSRRPQDRLALFCAEREARRQPPFRRAPWPRSPTCRRRQWSMSTSADFAFARTRGQRPENFGKIPAVRGCTVSRRRRRPRRLPLRDGRLPTAAAGNGIQLTRHPAQDRGGVRPGRRLLKNTTPT